MKEIFKNIIGYEGLYQISNYGNVKSLNYHNTNKSQLLKPSKNKYGYLRVTLCKNNKTKSYSIHRLVAISFIQNPNHYSIINHKDENPSNNNVENLEWCTCKYNSNYGTRNNRIKQNNILTKRKYYAKQVGCYKNNILIKKYPAVIDVEKDGFIATLVVKVCKGKRLTHKGYNWKYLT